jgi:neural Wiskott-Aldrich syndrome protein
MSADPNKKSGRTFQCRDVLWETFEQMARELECSVDYLINEAMKQYARQRSYGGASRTPLPGQRSDSPPQMPQQQGGQAQMQQGGQMQSAYGSMPTPAVLPPPAMRGSQLGAPPSQRMPPPPLRNSNLPAPPPPPQRGGGGGGGGGYPVPPPPRQMSPHQGMPQQQMQQPPMQPQQRMPSGGPPRSVPPPIPRGQQPPRDQMGGMGSNGFPGITPQGGTLSVIYQGEKLPVTKDRFVIGRGKQSSDLTLKDPNVSRQHAMIEFQNGVYFMVDMGSTNGVEYNGQRIARKQITEGDVFKICDHEMRFTYR